MKGLPRLKQKDLLTVNQLRKLDRPYFVAKTKKRKVICECPTHGRFVLLQLEVLANHSGCPDCLRLGLSDMWAFRKDDWMALLKVFRPNVKYVDKYETVESKMSYRHKCRLCGTRFNNSHQALRHRRWKCPGCGDQTTTEYADEVRTFLPKSLGSYKGYRKKAQYLVNVKAAFAVAKTFGTVAYPPQIEAPPVKPLYKWDRDLFSIVRKLAGKKPVKVVPVEEQSIPIVQPEEPTKPTLAAVEPDIMEVHDLEVLVLDDDPSENNDSPEDLFEETVVLPEDPLDAFLAEEDETNFIPTKPAVGVYLSRNGRLQQQSVVDEYEEMVREINSMNGYTNGPIISRMD